MRHQVRYDLLTFARNREAVFFTIALPIVFLVIFATVFGNDVVRVGDRELRQSAYYVPNLIALAITSAALQNLLFAIVTQREQGILKRRRSTPVPVAVLVGGRVAIALGLAYADFAVLALIGGAFYDVALPLAELPWILLTVGVGAAALCCVGYAFSTVIRSEDAAMPILQATILPLYFVSGVFFPEENVPGWLLGVGDVFPIRHLAQALLEGYAGDGFAPVHLLVLLAWGAVCAAIAVRRFKWVPQGR